MGSARAWSIALGSLLAASPASPASPASAAPTGAAGGDDPAGAPVDPGAAPAPEAQPAPAKADVERRLEALERENARMREELDQIKGDHAYLDQQVGRLIPLTGRLGGYLDFGFFYVQGNGSGVRPDTGHGHFPEYDGVVPDSWVFYGDPLSTAVNSRGEPADTGESRAVVFDPVGSDGKSSFIVNALNLALFAGIGDDVALSASVDLVPRSRNASTDEDTALGDFIDVKLAYVEYIVPVESFSLSLYAGKFDSVLGFEYRSLEAPDRLGVTPSLLCRYTCGTPLGLKARARFFDDKITANVAVTNGSHGIEQFPFHDEIDANQFKTIAGRISSRAPVGAGLEVGVSGAFGASDQQGDDAVHHAHVGIDLHLDWHDVLLTAELMRGEIDGATEPGGAPCGLSPCLHYKGAYGQLGYRLSNWLTPYARVDWRDALHENGESFVYVSELMRATGGARLELGTSVIVKAEYTFNLELGRAPQFPDDVFTSSMIVKY